VLVSGHRTRGSVFVPSRVAFALVSYTFTPRSHLLQSMLLCVALLCVVHAAGGNEICKGME
jgi:hypothetical protein